MDIITLDFNALNVEEKKEIIYTLDKALDKTAATFSFRQKILAQTLFVARSYHFYQQLFERFQMVVPTLFQDVMKHVWLYLLEEISMEELKKFHQATWSVFTCLFTGNDEYLDELAWEKYSEEWDDVSIGICSVDAATPDDILEQIVSGEINWHQPMGSVGNYISSCSLESVYKKETCGYKYEELQRHFAEIYDSPTFSRIFSLLQEDFRLVKELGNPTKEDILKLQDQYQRKELFTQQQMEKIADRMDKFYNLSARVCLKNTSD